MSFDCLLYGVELSGKRVYQLSRARIYAFYLRGKIRYFLFHIAVLFRELIDYSVLIGRSRVHFPDNGCYPRLYRGRLLQKFVDFRHYDVNLFLSCAVFDFAHKYTSDDFSRVAPPVRVRRL